jgi:hypothetical protein
VQESPSGERLINRLPALAQFQVGGSLRGIHEILEILRQDGM